MTTNDVIVPSTAEYPSNSTTSPPEERLHGLTHSARRSGRRASAMPAFQAASGGNKSKQGVSAGDQAHTVQEQRDHQPAGRTGGSHHHHHHRHQAVVRWVSAEGMVTTKPKAALRVNQEQILERLMLMKRKKGFIGMKWTKGLLSPLFHTASSTQPPALIPALLPLLPLPPLLPPPALPLPPHPPLPIQSLLLYQ